MQKSLIIMSNDFRQRVISIIKKKIWQNLFIMLKNFIKRRTQKLMISKSIVVKLIIESSKKQSNISNKFLETKFEILFKKLRKFRIDIDFELSSNDSIYYIDFEYRRLCISNVMKKKISNWYITIIRIRAFINVIID